MENYNHPIQIGLQMVQTLQEWRFGWLHLVRNMTILGACWRQRSHQIGSACMPSRFSCFQLFESPWTVACQAPLSMGFFRKEYWSGFPFPPPRDLPNPGIEPASLMSPALQVDSLPLEPPGKSFSYPYTYIHYFLDSFLIYRLSQNFE